jgi:hypothetical protein
MEEDEQSALDLAERMGADESAAIQRLTLYIPSRDADGNPFDAKPWVDEALILLSRIGGGATALPPVDGAWLNPETSRLVVEKVVLAYTFIDPDRFEATLDELRSFLHRLGRDTGQGEVVFEFDDRLYRIRAYDAA